MARADQWAEEQADSSRVKKRHKGPTADQTQIDFSPMADMVFQLLAFFLMTVKLATQETVDVPMLAHGAGVDLDQSTVITILAPKQPDTEPQIILGDRYGPSVTLDQVRERIEDALGQGKPNMIIKAERLAPCGVVQQVSRIVASANANLYIAVRDEE